MSKNQHVLLPEALTHFRHLEVIPCNQKCSLVSGDNFHAFLGHNLFAIWVLTHTSLRRYSPLLGKEPILLAFSDYYTQDVCISVHSLSSQHQISPR